MIVLYLRKLKERKIKILIFDDEKAAKRLMEDYHPHLSFEEALEDIKGKHRWDERLQPAFDTWLNGGTPEFEHAGISLAQIKENTRDNGYYECFLGMDLILENPERWIKHYSNPKSFMRC